MSIASETLEELKKINARLDKIEAFYDMVNEAMEKFGPIIEQFAPMLSPMMKLTGLGIEMPDNMDFSQMNILNVSSEPKG